MGLKSIVREAMCSLLRRYGYEVIDGQQVYDWQLTPVTKASYNPAELPDGAAEYLRPDNPRLVDLQARYDAFDSQVTEPLVWKADWVSPEEIAHFRGDNAYVWQLRGHNMNAFSYALTTYYAKSIDSHGILNRIGEDDLFGNYTFTIADTLVSRDLLDSVLELYFLERHLGITGQADFSMLDIGAGYGRLAYRAVTALPNVSKFACTDGVAVSTFISEYYARFRKVDDRVAVVPLDEIEERLTSWKPRVAVNIHSFSECQISAIDWWTSLLSRSGVEYLMIAPNAGDHGGSQLKTNNGRDFGEILKKHGYELIAKDPKFGDPVVQKYGINPTYHYLFQLR